MCLAIPSKILEIHEDQSATVETLGAKKKISLQLMPESVEKGDYLLIHVGYAIGKLKEKEAMETLAMYEEIQKNVDRSY